MNALDIVESVRRHGADLMVQDGQLVVTGSGPPLPDAVRQELRAHKAELLIALGEPLDRTIAGILADIRPYLAAALRNLPDDRLLALVNWNIMAAWNASLRR